MGIDHRRRALLLGTLGLALLPGNARAAATPSPAVAPSPSIRIPPDPDVGPKSTIVRDARHKMLFYQPQYEFRGPTAGLQDAQAKATPILYIPPVQNGVGIGGKAVFDHSEAGIEAGAERACRFIMKQAPEYGLNIGILDLEMLPSVNVPPDLGYDPDNRKDKSVVVYSPLEREAFRSQAVRFNRLMATAMFRRLREEMPKFELGWYNIPRAIGWYDREPEQVTLQVERTYQEAYPAVLEPFAAFTGPSSQMVVSSSMIKGLIAGKIGEDDLIDWKVRSCRAFKEKFGPLVNVVPSIWPRWFIIGSPKPGPDYPDGSVVVPPGFMTKLCTRLLDEAGVSGFMCWRASTDDDYEELDPGYQRRLSDRWAEVAAVVNQRSDFRAVEFSAS
jgi:hypothetical protein